MSKSLPLRPSCLHYSQHRQISAASVIGLTLHVCVLVLSTLTFSGSIREVAAGKIIDGEDFLRQDFADATSFKTMLKKKGIDLPEKPKPRSEEEMIHLRRRRRTKLGRPGAGSSGRASTRSSLRKRRPKLKKASLEDTEDEEEEGGQGETDEAEEGNGDEEEGGEEAEGQDQEEEEEEEEEEEPAAKGAKGKQSKTSARKKKGKSGSAGSRSTSTFAVINEEDTVQRTDGCKRLVWVMAVYKDWDLAPAAAHALYTRLQVALLSARVHAPSLIPVLLYDGTPNAFTAWWETSGGRILFAYTSLYSALSTCKGSWADTESHTRSCRASYMFVDLPQLVPNVTRTLAEDVSTEYVLYTSPDIIFLKDVDSCVLGEPKIMAVGRDHKDSGGLSLDIAYVNLDGLAKQYNKIAKTAKEGNYQLPNCVQGAVFGAIPEGKLEYMPVQFQWKGYWGGSNDVAIVQFNGPKPLDCLPCLTEFPEEASLCEARCDATSIALFGFTRDKGTYYKWLMHVYFAFVETPVRFVEYAP